MPYNNVVARCGRWLHRRVVYPAAVRVRGEHSVFARLEEMHSLQHLSPDELLLRQSERVAALLEYVRGRVPRYRGSLSGTQRIDPGDAVGVLSSLPTISKAQIQDQRLSFLAEPAPARVANKTTGGSTGQPVTIAKDAGAVAHEMAASWLGYGWFGIEMGDRAARFWGSPATVKRRLRYAAADLAMHRIRFSAFAFGDEDLERYWNRCVKFGPDYFYGYVSMLEAFAHYVNRRGLDGSLLNLKAIVTTSEVLTEPQRDLLGSTFNTRVQNEYGCGEVGPIAYECEEGSLHIMADNVFVEIVDEQGRPVGAGESGALLITDLNNRAMPLIRYQVGDFGVRGEQCRCGRGFPVLEKIWGRAYDFIEAPDGRRYHGEYFMYMFEDFRKEGIAAAQFQVTQRAVDKLEFAVVAGGDDLARLSQRIRARVAPAFGGVEISVVPAESIQRAASGKIRLIRNEVHVPTSEAAEA